jgi:cell wall-associated NlpC family hydrolase
MERLVLGVLLDDGGRQLQRALCGALTLVGLGLVMLVVLPIALLTQAAAPPNGLGTAALQAPTNGRAVDRPPLGPTGNPAGNPPLGPLPPSSTGSQSVEVARRYLGVPYVFGGSNPAVGLDCSGLVQLVFHQLGVALPRTAQLQFDATPRVSQADLQPGDLVFFARTYADPHDWVTHVGIYLGGGLQINAPTEGQVVSIQPVFSGFWGAHYAGAGRVRGA